MMLRVRARGAITALNLDDGMKRTSLPPFYHGAAPLSPRKQTRPAP